MLYAPFMFQHLFEHVISPPSANTCTGMVIIWDQLVNICAEM